MKIQKPMIKKMIWEQKSDEDIIDEAHEEIPINIDTNNPIEADKEIELANSVKPVNRDNMNSIIGDIEKHDLEINDKIDNIELLDKVSAESLKTVISKLVSESDKFDYILSGPSEIVNNEITAIKSNVNNDVLKTIVQDLESVKNLFTNTIELVKSREEDVTTLLRRLDKPEVPEDIMKSYDLTNILTDIGSINYFINNNKLEKLIGCLLFIINNSQLDLSKEDNDILNSINKDDQNQLSKIENLLLDRIKNDKYTEELNKRAVNQHSVYGNILSPIEIEVLTPQNYVLSTVKVENINYTFEFNTELNSLNTILNSVKETYSVFQEELIEDLKILEKKYESIIPVIKGNIVNLNSPDKNMVAIGWRNLLLARTIYVTLMTKRLSDKMLAHQALMRIILTILKA